MTQPSTYKKSGQDMFYPIGAIYLLAMNPNMPQSQYLSLCRANGVLQVSMQDKKVKPHTHVHV